MNSVNACCELELAKTLSSSIINEQHDAAKNLFYLIVFKLKKNILKQAHTSSVCHDLLCQLNWLDCAARPMTVFQD